MRHARALREEMAEWTGLEPATPGVTGRYSNQLNYHSACWWVLRGSNPRPSPCKGDALPAELSTPLEEGREYTRGSPAWLGACLNISREPRWQGRISVRCSWAWPTPLDPCTGADAMRAAQAIVGTMDQPSNAADAPAHGSAGTAKYNGCARAKCLAHPSGPGRFPLMRRCRLLIGSLPNLVGSALPEGKSAAVAATRNTQTGS